MKKLTVLIACCLGVLFFASCDPEVIEDILAKKPTVEFVTEEHVTSAETYGINMNESLTLNVRIAPNEESGSGLNEFVFTIQKTNENGEIVLEDRQAITEDKYDPHFFEETFQFTEAGNYYVTALVRDDAGAENVAVAYVDVAAPIVEPLGNFTGNLKIAGTVTVNNPFTGSNEIELTPMDAATTIQLGNTDENGMSEAILNIDGNQVTLQCKRDGDTFIFDTFHFTKPLDLTVFTVDFNIEITDMVGTLHDDMMTITAIAKGDGSYQQLVTANLDGNMEGELEKDKE